jgi:hypothetical protein
MFAMQVLFGMLLDAALSPDARHKSLTMAVSQIREFFRALVGAFQDLVWFRRGRTAIASTEAVM